MDILRESVQCLDDNTVLNPTIGNNSMVDLSTLPPPIAQLNIPKGKRTEHGPPLNTSPMERAINAFEKNASGSAREATEGHLFGEMVALILSKN